MTNYVYLSARAKLMWDPLLFSKDQVTSIFGMLSMAQLITTELSSSALDSNLPDLFSKTRIMKSQRLKKPPISHVMFTPHQPTNRRLVHLKILIKRFQSLVALSLPSIDKWPLPSVNGLF